MYIANKFTASHFHCPFAFTLFLAEPTKTTRQLSGTLGRYLLDLVIKAVENMRDTQETADALSRIYIVCCGLSEWLLLRLCRRSKLPVFSCLVWCKVPLKYYVGLHSWSEEWCWYSFIPGYIRKTLLLLISRKHPCPVSSLKHRHAKRARVLFFCDRSIRRTVHSNDLVKFFWVAMYSKKRNCKSIICKYNVTSVMVR